MPRQVSNEGALRNDSIHDGLTSEQSAFALPLQSTVNHTHYVERETISGIWLHPSCKLTDCHVTSSS